MSGSGMLPEVLTWWTVLCGLALLNVCAWFLCAHLLRRRRAEFAPEAYSTRRVLLWLAAAYVVGCGFRSVFPMVDVPRICLHGTPFGRIAIGRTVATIAEMSFAAQFCLLLREAGRALGRAELIALGPLLFVLIAIAEAFSWAAVLRSDFALHAIENSIWTVASALGVVAFVSLRSRLAASGRRFVVAVLLGGALYIVFMTTVDVPSYVSRWVAATASGHQAVSLTTGLEQILAPCRVVRNWAAWRDDVVWLTLYFSAAVWTSIALVHAPALVPARR
jgi:cytochrome bd-type quinol oxidase subunit 2